MAKTQFLLCSAPGTGSSMLAARLSQLPQVICFPAVFAKAGWPKGRVGKRAADPARALLNDMSQWEDCDDRIARHGQFIKDLLNAAASFSAVGIKHSLSGPDQQFSQELLSDSRWKRIVLQRENLLASYADKLAAKNPTLHFDANEFSVFRTRRAALYRKWKVFLAVGDCATIDYAEASREDGVRRLCSFLGVEYAQAPGEAQHARHDDIASRFSNKNDVVRYLRENDLMNWAREGGTVEAPRQESSTENAAKETAAAPDKAKTKTPSGTKNPAKKAGAPGKVSGKSKPKTAKAPKT